MFCPHKNSYLQLTTSGCNPRLINRAVSEALECPTDTFDKEPAFFRLSSHQPNIPAQNVDVTRREQAFGRWALPKLRRELHDECPGKVSQAVNSIMDIVHDPERAFEAVELRIIDRLADLMINEDPTIRERVCMILNTLATQEAGREAICKCEPVVLNLLLLLEDDEAYVRMKAATCTRTISDSWMACDKLVHYSYIMVIVEVLLREDQDILVVLLDTLQHLMYGEGKEMAFSYGAYDVMVVLLDRDNEEVVAGALSCLSVLATLKHAKKFSVEIGLLNKLARLLLDPRQLIHTAAAEALMFTTHRTKAKKQAAQIPELVPRLVVLAGDFHYPRLQMFAMKALTNIAEHPSMRALMMKDYLKKIREIPIATREPMPENEVRRYKKTLNDVIVWKP